MGCMDRSTSPRPPAKRAVTVAVCTAAALLCGAELSRNGNLPAPPEPRAGERDISAKALIVRLGSADLKRDERLAIHSKLESNLPRASLPAAEINELLAVGNSAAKVSALRLIAAAGDRGAPYASNVLALIKDEVSAIDAALRINSRFIEPVDTAVTGTSIKPALDAALAPVGQKVMERAEVVRAALSTLRSLPGHEKLLTEAANLSRSIKFADLCEETCAAPARLPPLLSR